jgi:alkylation response protein AidB-like acyl-CoA dehydrogenase
MQPMQPPTRLPSGPNATGPEATGPDGTGRALLQSAADLRVVIRRYQEEIERERMLPTALVDQLRAAGLYRLLVPRSLGGSQLDLLTLFRVLALVGEGDGAVGWNLCNSAGFNLFVLSLPDEGVQEIYAHGPDVVFAGALGARGGQAVAVDGGYRATGRWRFGSGCQQAEWLCGSCEIRDGDQPQRDADGTPLYLRAFFPAAAVTIHDTWEVTGLRGTGSHDWSVSNVFVPTQRTSPFPANDPWKNRWSRWPGTLYALPSHAWNGPFFAAVATGIARASIDALCELAGRKVPRTTPGLLRDQAQVQEWVGRAEALVGAAQAYLFGVTQEVWEAVEATGSASLEQQARCRVAGSYAVDSALQAVELMYRAGGTTSIEQSHLLGRCWRDLQVLGQNFTVAPEYYGHTGRVFLGMEPSPKMS